MALTLSQYTSPDEVRAVLGLSSDELADETVALDVYVYGLESAISDINVNLLAQYSQVHAIDFDLRTPEQQRLLQTVRMYATYKMADLHADALPMMAAKDIGDGKAYVSRFSGTPYKDLINTIKANVSLYRGQVADALVAVLPSASVAPRGILTLMRVVAPAVDIVTGE